MCSSRRCAARGLEAGEPPATMDFDELKRAVGFPAYYAEEARYRLG
jgi:hypothetical protein